MPKILKLWSKPPLMSDNLDSFSGDTTNKMCFHGDFTFRERKIERVLVFKTEKYITGLKRKTRGASDTNKMNTNYR